MKCPRCEEPDDALVPGRWCKQCESAYDVWSRRYATEIVWEVLVGTSFVVFAGMGLPLLGASWLFAATGIFAGFGAIVGLHRLNRRRHRREYLRSGEVPRAYLPSKT